MRSAGLRITGSVRRTQVNPASTIVSQHPSHLGEHGHHRRHVGLGRGLKPELGIDAAGAALAARLPVLCEPSRVLRIGAARDRLLASSAESRRHVIAPRRPALPRRRAIVTQASSPVRRRGNARLHTPRWKRFEDFQAIALVDFGLIAHRTGAPPSPIRVSRRRRQRRSGSTSWRNFRLPATSPARCKDHTMPGTRLRWANGYSRWRQQARLRYEPRARPS